MSELAKQDGAQVTNFIRHYDELPLIYARLARMVADELMRLKGVSKEDAEKQAVQMMLNQMRDTQIGMEEIDVTRAKDQAE